MAMNPGVQDRVWLWEQNADTTLKAWRKQGSDPDLALIVADLNDNVGRAITTAIAQHQGTEQELNKLILGTRGLIPTSYMLMVREDLSMLLERNNLASHNGFWTRRLQDTCTRCLSQQAEPR